MIHRIFHEVFHILKKFHMVFTWTSHTFHSVAPSSDVLLLIVLQDIVKRIKPRVIKHGQAVRLRAKQDLVDKKGKYVLPYKQHCSFVLISNNISYQTH